MSQPIESTALTAGSNGQASLSERVKGLRLGGHLEGKKSGGGGSAWLPWTLCFLMGIAWASFAIRAYTAGGLKGLLGEMPSTSSAATVPSEGNKSQKAATPVGPPAKPGEMVLDRKGIIIAAHQIQVSPIEVSGRIVKLAIDEGKKVEKGTILAELDKTPFQADYDEAKGYLDSAKARLSEIKQSWPIEVDQARAQLKEAQSLLNQYEADYKRYEEIRKTTAGVADKEYDLAKYSFFTQSARVTQMEKGLLLMEGPRKLKIAGAEAEVIQAQARFDRTRWRLENCQIVAPVTGIILTKRAEIGNLVNALAMNTTLNGGICDMADLTDLEIDLDVDERDISKVRVGQDCEVRTDAYPKRRYQGRVDRILPTAKSAVAQIPIRVKIRVPRTEEGVYLKPQMAANVLFFNRDAPPETPEPPEPVVDP
jgi:HlyD family secretion protein